MPEIQSIITSAWGAGADVQSVASLVWRESTSVQSIGSVYTPPPAPPGSTVVNSGDLTPRTEILPAASYRSAQAPLMRNVRMMGSANRIFYAPLTSGAEDTVSPLEPFSISGAPTFSAAGMLSTPGAYVYYPANTNSKLWASNYTFGIRYRVRCENLTSMPPPNSPYSATFFTLYGFRRQFGFTIGTDGSLRTYEYDSPSLSLGTIPNDSVLSIVYPQGSGRGELWINETMVHRSSTNSRFNSAISLGLSSGAALSALRFSQLRVERIPALSNGLMLEDGLIISDVNGSIELPDNSALWRMSATIPRASYDLLRAGEQPPTVSITLANRTWVFVVDEMSAPRGFASTDVAIRGVSLAALADAPYQLARQWTSDAPTTAAQIAEMTQTFTGLNVSWQLTDWGMPAGAWSYTGTPWGAVLQLAAPVQAVVEADPSDLKVKISSRYPVMPQQWATTAPDVQVPWQAVESENVTAADRPAYTGVFVSGPTESIAAVRLAGTSGAEQAPLLSNDLLTDLSGQVELGRTVLAQSGGAETVTRSLQVLTGAGEPGVIDRGKLVRWVDPEATWTGMVRAVRVDWQFGLMRQSVTCERRTSFPAGSVETLP